MTGKLISPIVLCNCGISEYVVKEFVVPEGYQKAKDEGV
jgi:hypothetical protein